MSAILCGSGVFTGNSVNDGEITEDAIFQDTASNNGNITGNATFQGTSTNTGTVAGNATFQDTASNTGTIHGNATFESITANQGNVVGTVTFSANGMIYDTSVGWWYDYSQSVDDPVALTHVAKYNAINGNWYFYTNNSDPINITNEFYYVEFNWYFFPANSAVNIDANGTYIYKSSDKNWYLLTYASDPIIANGSIYYENTQWYQRQHDNATPVNVSNMRIYNNIEGNWYLYNANNPNSIDANNTAVRNNSMWDVYLPGNGIVQYKSQVVLHQTLDPYSPSWTWYDLAGTSVGVEDIAIFDYDDERYYWYQADNPTPIDLHNKYHYNYTSEDWYYYQSSGHVLSNGVTFYNESSVNGALGHWYNLQQGVSDPIDVTDSYAYDSGDGNWNIMGVNVSNSVVFNASQNMYYYLEKDSPNAITYVNPTPALWLDGTWVVYIAGEKQLANGRYSNGAFVDGAIDTQGVHDGTGEAIDNGSTYTYASGIIV